MGFTKLDSGLIQSSLLTESAETFKVFMVFLAICEADGIARASSVFLSSICRLPQDVVDRAIERLSSKDETSRSEAEGGARIRRVDGGYFIINYQKYREWTYSKSDEAVRKRRYRDRKEGHVGTSGTLDGTASVNVPNDGTRRDNVRDIPDISASASASSSASSLEEGERGRKLNQAFEAAGLGSIFDERLARYLLKLWEEYSERVDFLTEIKKKLAHIVGMKGKITGSTNFPLQFRNWMVNAVKFKERDAAEMLPLEQTPESKPKISRAVLVEKIKDEVWERHRAEYEAIKASGTDVGLYDLSKKMEKEAIDELARREREIGP